jgi:hypothetical protein
VLAKGLNTSKVRPQPETTVIPKHFYSKALPQASFGNPIDHFRVDQATGEVTCCAAVKAANQPRYGRTRPCEAITNVIP